MGRREAIRQNFVTSERATMCVRTNLETRKDEVSHLKRDSMSKLKNMRGKLTPTQDQGIKLDALAVLTARQKHFVDVFNKQIEAMQRTKAYK